MMNATLSTLLFLSIPCLALAQSAPSAPTSAQMDILHGVFEALHVAKDGAHPPHPGGHHGPSAAAGVETIHVDTTRNFTPADGSAAHGSHIIGDLSVKVSMTGGEPSHTLSGTLISTDAQAHTSTVTFTGVTHSHAQHCMLPSAGQAVLKGADGTQHAVVFSATCGQVSVDGASVTLPKPGHHGHGPDEEHDGE